MRTRSGRPLDAAELERLASQAEDGFDLAKWKPRRGRPSLTGPGEQSPRVSVRLPEDVYRRVSDRAADEGKTISRVVRELLESYGSERS